VPRNLKQYQVSGITHKSSMAAWSKSTCQSDHRIASIPNAEPVITSTSAMSFTDQSFGNVFSAYLESTLTNITNDPFISNPVLYQHYL
jgi:hypothetical protein